MNAFLKLGWAMLSLGADEARAQLDPDRAHFEIGGDRLAAADPAGDEHRHVLGDVGQDFLRQHRRRHRADMAARLHALDHQCVDARAHQFLRQRQRGREADQLRSAALDPVDRPGRRQPACEDDMASPDAWRRRRSTRSAAGAW